MVLQDGTSSLVYGLDLISMKDGAGNRRYFSYDGLDSTSDLSGAGGNVTDTYSYDVFGAVRARTGTNASPWKFTGEQEDGAVGDSGYYFLRARYYDARLGRFVSRDPLEFDQRYAYAGGNPVLMADPTGRNPEDATWCGSTTGLGRSERCAGKAVCANSALVSGVVYHYDCGGLPLVFLTAVGRGAVTIEHDVYSHQPNLPRKTIVHEACHVGQWERHGRAGFILRYVTPGNGMEAEAEAFESLASRSDLPLQVALAVEMCANGLPPDVIESGDSAE